MLAEVGEESGEEKDHPRMDSEGHRGRVDAGRIAGRHRIHHHRDIVRVRIQPVAQHVTLLVGVRQ